LSGGSLIYLGFGLNADPSRVAAGVVTGIGFIGAGAILRIRGDEGVVVGLTTAASVWAVAAIGIAAGTGLYWLSVIATAIVVLAL